MEYEFYKPFVFLGSGLYLKRGFQETVVTRNDQSRAFNVDVIDCTR